jgi:flagellin-like protein
MRKRGLSPVVATVLIIMITIVAIGLIAPFVIKFIKGNLIGSEDCFEVLEDLTLGNTGYNCGYKHPVIAGIEGTGFSVKIDNPNIVAFKVSLFTAGSAKTYEINNGATFADIRMLDDAAFGLGLDVPQNGGVKTYVSDLLVDRVELFPILEDGRVCDATAVFNVAGCNDAQVITDITTP